jgi:hypothetical protein
LLGVPGPTIPLPPGLELGGRYRLGAVARSGVGNSYMAHDVVDDRQVVVKLLAAMPFDVDVARVERAVAPLLALDATYLPRLHGVFEERIDGRHCVFLAQDWVEGETLEERVLRTGPLPPAEARSLARRLLELMRTFQGLESPLIHGDINPANLVLGEGGLCLVDWGAPKAAARDWSGDSYGPEGWTQAVQRAFAAPEVPMGSVNARSDLYGVGACVAYALTGYPPEELRDLDDRRVLSKALERQHVPRSLASVLVPLLEPTLEQRLASPQDALDRLMDPLAGRRGGFTVRRAGDAVDWHMEPQPLLGGLWSGLGVTAAALLALPTIIAAVAAVVPVAFGMSGEIIALRIGLGLLLGAVGLLALRSGIRAFSPMGRLRLQGMGRAFRYQRRRDWVEIPWLQLGRVRKLGPLVRIDGSWCVPPSIIPRRHCLWVAPVYDDDLDRLVARIGAQRVRARGMVSQTMRPGERRWAGAPRMPLGLALPFGLFALAALLFTGRWGAEEPEPSMGVLGTPRPELLRLEGEPVADDQLQGAIDARLALTELAAQRPAATPQQARVMAVRAAQRFGADLDATAPDHSAALAGFERSLAEALGQPVPALEEASSDAGAPPDMVDAPEAAPAAAPSLHLDQAVHPLAAEPLPGPPAARGAPVEGAGAAAPPPAAHCPRGFQPRTLASQELMATACYDEHGTMVLVPRSGGQAAFYVDWTEVSVADYARCLADGGCSSAREGPGCYGREAARGRYPVNCVDRSQAEDWCAWAGRRLCTLSEHRRAAAGPGGEVYPWGDAGPSCDRAIMDARGQAGPAGEVGCGRGSPWPVGSRPAGVSGYGALDLSGNLAEWVAGSPKGAAGGGYMDKAPEELQCGSLRPVPPDFPLPDVGFRCCLGR